MLASLDKKGEDAGMVIRGGCVRGAGVREAVAVEKWIAFTGSKCSHFPNRHPIL